MTSPVDRLPHSGLYPYPGHVSARSSVLVGFSIPKSEDLSIPLEANRGVWVEIGEARSAPYGSRSG